MSTTSLGRPMDSFFLWSPPPNHWVVSILPTGGDPVIRGLRAGLREVARLTAVTWHADLDSDFQMYLYLCMCICIWIGRCTIHDWGSLEVEEASWGKLTAVSWHADWSTLGGEDHYLQKSVLWGRTLAPALVSMDGGIMGRAGEV